MADSITPVQTPVTAPVKAPEAKTPEVKAPEITGTVAAAKPEVSSDKGAGVDKATPTDKQAKKLYMMA